MIFFRLLKGGNKSLAELLNTKGTAAANTDVVISLPAVAGREYQIISLIWSYDVLSLAAKGSLKIEDGSGNSVFDIDILQGGPGSLPVLPIMGSTNTAMIITLSAISSAIGKLNVGYTLE